MLETMKGSAALYGVRAFLVCLMPNHVHLLVETPRGNLSSFMGRLLTAYSVYFNRRHQRVGHLTQGRYKAQVVEGDAYLMKLSRYIHLNPVQTKALRDLPLPERRRLLRNFPWSTYRGYAGLDEKWDWIEFEPVWGLLPKSAGERAELAYRSYVETGLATTDEDFLEAYSNARLALGPDDFRRGVEGRHLKLLKASRSKEDVAFRRAPALQSAQTICQAVATVFGVPMAELVRRKRGHPARAALCWYLVHSGGLTQRNVAELVGLQGGTAVAYQLKLWATRWSILDEIAPMKSALNSMLGEK